MDGKKIASGGDDKLLKLYDLENERELRSIAGHPEWISSIAFSPDGLYLLTGCGDNIMRLFSVYSGTQIRSFTGHSEFISGVSFSYNGKLVASSSMDKKVKIFDFISGEEKYSLPSENEIDEDFEIDAFRALTFSPKGSYLFIGGEDKKIRM